MTKDKKQPIKVAEFKSKKEALCFAKEISGYIESTIDDKLNWVHYVFYK